MKYLETLSHSLLLKPRIWGGELKRWNLTDSRNRGKMVIWSWLFIIQSYHIHVIVGRVSNWTISQVFLEFKDVYWKHPVIWEMQKPNPGPPLNSFTAVLYTVGLNIFPKGLWCGVYWENLQSLPDSSRYIIAILWKI